MIFQELYSKEARSVLLIMSVTIVICFSVSFISFTTSGLENPLLFILVIIYLRLFITSDSFTRKQLFYIALLEGLIALTRMDCAIIFSVTSAYVFIKYCGKFDHQDGCDVWSYLRRFFDIIPIGIFGLFPFIIWELFSWFYYGSLIPNTALSKLNTGFPLYQYVERGIWYYYTT